jgi:hypothetical protein
VEIPADVLDTLQVRADGRIGEVAPSQLLNQELTQLLHRESSSLRPKLSPATRKCQFRNTRMRPPPHTLHSNRPVFTNPVHVDEKRQDSIGAGPRDQAQGVEGASGEQVG